MTDQPAPVAGTAPAGGPPARPSGTVRKLTVILLGLTAVVTLMLCAFALPSVHGGPHKVPIGVSGPQAATEALTRKLPGAEWEVTVYADKAALTADIEDGDVSGGLVLTADGPEIYTATAGAPMATNALTALGNGIAAEQHAEATVHELVPFTADDPRGSGFAAAALPMIFGGMFPAIILTRLFPGHAGLRVRLAGVVVFSLLAGFAVTALLQYGTGSLGGAYALTSLGMSLGMAALSLTFIGLEALVGFAGLGAGAALMMFLGNPLSGLQTGPHWLPNGWSTFGQLLPPGAAGSLLRANAFFDGAHAAAPLVVLTAWVLLGLVLLFTADRRGRGARRAGERAETKGPVPLAA
ncbi:hypothetical protein ACQYWQ_07295 [Streptomyces sp. P6-2-1]|uniref:hypothetical protein n=1 Tax=Streptomyces sp. P6-2-1 TaxID=3422591 RepID=UPI003D36905C